MRKFLLAGVVALAVVVVPAAAASAHPLGNFSVNLYSGLRVGPDHVTIDYVVDLAEIPTFQARGSLVAATRCRQLAGGAKLAIEGRPVPLAVGASAVRISTGSGGLDVARISCRLEGAFARSAPVSVTYRDANYADRVGWREVVAVGDGTVLRDSNVPTTSISHRLTSYPNALLRSPLHVTSASVRAVPGGARAGSEVAADPGVRTSGLPLGADRLSARYTALVARQHVTAPFLAGAVALSLLLGALHALAPGHGKTVMAAYLVGRRGSMRQALLIGLTVTATHTAGVLALGVLLSATRLIAPDRLYPWLSLASGVLFAAIGVSLLARTVRHRRAHAHGHHHHHHDHGHDHDHTEISWRSLVTMGLAGGMVPTPSALVVLLGAIALGRTWLGVVLVVLYGVGMAATLTGAGLLLVRARGALEHRGERFAALGRVLPLATASVIVVVGMALVARGAAKVV